MRYIVLLAALGGCIVPAHATPVQTATTRQAADLRDAPYRDAVRVASLPAQTRVETLERRGAWARVKTANGKSGWVRLQEITLGDGVATRSATDSASTLWNLSRSGRSGAQGIDATTGIRGLDAADLQKAAPNEAALKTIEAYRTNADGARQFAQAEKLREQDLAFVPKPEAAK